MQKYSLIYADPPWLYDNEVSNGAATNHYGCMKLQDLKRLPVWDLAADDAVLAMWYTGTHVKEAFELADAWGFDVRQSFAFVWVKLNALAGKRFDKALDEGTLFDFHDLLDMLNAETRMNGGNYTRQNAEIVLIAVKGKGLERASKSVKQIVFSCLGEHSSKPAEVRHRLDQMYGPVPRIELFSRSSLDGWHCWGNQCSTDVYLSPGRAFAEVQHE